MAHPAGMPLRQRQKTFAKPLADEDGMVRYRASQFDCVPFPLKPRCCPKAPARKILRSVHEGARDMARNLATTQAYVTSRRERKKVEMLFAQRERSPLRTPSLAYAYGSGHKLKLKFRLGKTFSSALLSTGACPATSKRSVAAASP